MRELLRRRGFTLMELMMALAIAMIVIVGVVMLATTAARYQLGLTSKGNAAGNDMFMLNRMQREFEDSTVLFRPAPVSNTPTTDVVVYGCTNWSRDGAGPGVGGRYNPLAAPDPPCAGGNNVTTFYYCVNGGVMYRHYACGTTCQNLAAACGSSGGAVQVVVPNPPGVFTMDNTPGYFFKRIGDRGLEMHFIVGITTPTSSRPIPAGYKMNVMVTTNRAYSNTND